MKFSEHNFERLDEIFAQKPINQLIDDGIKPNWGTWRQNPEANLKIILNWFIPNTMIVSTMPLTTTSRSKTRTPRMNGYYVVNIRQ